MDSINKSTSLIKTNDVKKWQESKETLKERFSFLFNNEKLSDICFVVGQDKQHRIHAHKVVLAASSDVFEAMFYGPLATKSDQIELPDVEPQSFLAFLKFIYSDEVEIDKETVMSTIYLAKKYNVPAFKKYCIHFLQNNLDCDHAVLLLMQAQFFDEPQLADICFNYIDRNSTNVFSSDDFLNLDLDCLIALLERDTLQIIESKLYQAVLRWAAAECARKQLSLTPENQRSVLGRAFMLIRFPLMSIEEFSSGPVKSKLLDYFELTQLILYITGNPPTKPSTIQFSNVPRGKESTHNLQLLTRYNSRTGYDGTWGYDGIRIDSIRFMVDRRIFVVGFGLFGAPKRSVDYDVNLQILLTEEKRSCGSNKTSFKCDGTSKTFLVKFKEPVEILPNRKYTAKVAIKGPSTWYGCRGEKKITVNGLNGPPIKFQFFSDPDSTNGTNVHQGQIPDIVFYT